MTHRFYISPTADGTPFDNDTNGFTADNVQNAIEESRISGIGTVMSVVFAVTGNTSNKWLGHAIPSTPSDVVPFILPQDSDLKGLTFSNNDNNVDIDVEIYRNGTLAYTWEIRNKRVAWTLGLAGPSFSQSDRVSCFLRKFASGSGDNTAQDPIVEVMFKIMDEEALTGGIQNGV